MWHENDEHPLYDAVGQWEQENPQAAIGADSVTLWDLAVYYVFGAEAQSQYIALRAEAHPDILKVFDELVESTKKPSSH